MGAPRTWGATPQVSRANGASSCTRLVEMARQTFRQIAARIAPGRCAALCKQDSGVKPAARLGRLADEVLTRYNGGLNYLSPAPSISQSRRGPPFEKQHMVRKVVNRKELRQESEAAERLGVEASPKATKAAKAAKAPKAPKDPNAKPKRKSRAKTAKEVRLKAFWGVFNQSMKRVALFEYSQRGDADKKAAEMSVSQKTPHFVQPVKEAIAE